MKNNKELVKTAKKILTSIIKIPKTKKILLIRDENNNIINAFEKAFISLKLKYKILDVNIKRKNSEPIPFALMEMKKADYIIAPTKNSISHCPETTYVVNLGKKVITLPGITDNIFLKINKTNYNEIKNLNSKIEKFMKNKSIVNIKTKSGTDVTLSIKNRKWIGNENLKKGYIINLPIGETFCAPIENSANGIIYIDYFKDRIKPKDKAWIKVQNGIISEWNPAASEYVKEQNVKNGFVIAEIGIGTNKAHKKPIGNILHDEKIYGTCHIAFGQNTSFGGKNSSPVHNDIILLKPTITVDGKKFKI